MFEASNDEGVSGTVRVLVVVMLVDSGEVESSDLDDSGKYLLPLFVSLKKTC